MIRGTDRPPNAWQRATASATFVLALVGFFFFGLVRFVAVLRLVAVFRLVPVLVLVLGHGATLVPLPVASTAL